MSADQLFELGEGDRRPPAEPQPKLSTDRRRTLRQKQALDAGKHPTSLYFGRTIRLHADAAPAEDRKAEGLRCGDCALLYKNGWGYLKCNNVSESHGPATDIRAWWPACVNHKAAE